MFDLFRKQFALDIESFSCVAFSLQSVVTTLSVRTVPLNRYESLCVVLALTIQTRAMLMLARSINISNSSRKHRKLTARRVDGNIRDFAGGEGLMKVSSSLRVIVNACAGEKNSSSR